MSTIGQIAISAPQRSAESEPLYRATAAPARGCAAAERCSPIRAKNVTRPVVGINDKPMPAKTPEFLSTCVKTWQSQ